MADISAFPTITKVVDQGQENCRAFKAGGTIKAGMTVAFARTGVTDTVLAHLKGTTGSIVGVAAEDIASGSWGNVYTNGAVVYVANADDTTAITPGELVEGNDNAVGGTVSAASGHATTANKMMIDILGYAVETIAGGASGRVMIALQSTNRNQG